MNWADMNPFRRANKPASAGPVYLGVNQATPHAGISVISDVRPAGGSFCLEGVPLDQAKLDLCGKVLDWEKVPAKYIASLKTGGSITLPLDRLKTLFR